MKCIIVVISAILFTNNSIAQNYYYYGYSRKPVFECNTLDKLLDTFMNQHAYKEFLNFDKILDNSKTLNRMSAYLNEKFSTNVFDSSENCCWVDISGYEKDKHTFSIGIFEFSFKSSNFLKSFNARKDERNKVKFKYKTIEEFRIVNNKFYCIISKTPLNKAVLHFFEIFKFLEINDKTVRR